MRVRRLLSLLLTLCMFLSLGCGANAELLSSSPDNLLIIEHFFVLDDFGLDYLSEARIIITRYLEDNMGFNRAAVAGILSNMYSESSLRSDALGDGGTSYGLCQWHAVRFNMLDDFASENDSSISDITTQLDFFRHEMTELYPALTEKLRNVENSLDGAYVAAYLMCNDYERPLHSERKSHIRGQNAQTDYSENAQDEYLYNSDELQLMADNYMDHMEKSDPYIMDFSTFDSYITLAADIVGETVIGGTVHSDLSADSFSSADAEGESGLSEFPAEGADSDISQSPSAEDSDSPDSQKHESEGNFEIFPEADIIEQTESDDGSSELSSESETEANAESHPDESCVSEDISILPDSDADNGNQESYIPPHPDEEIPSQESEQIPVAEIPSVPADVVDDGSVQDISSEEDNDVAADNLDNSPEDIVPVAENPGQESDTTEIVPQETDSEELINPDVVPEASDPDSEDFSFYEDIESVIEYSLENDGNGPKMYQVRFLYEDGSLICPIQTVAEGESAEPPCPRNIEGKYFSHWTGNIGNITHDTDIVAVYANVEDATEEVIVVPEEVIEEMVEPEVAHKPPETVTGDELISDLPDEEKSSGDGKPDDGTDDSTDLSDVDANIGSASGTPFESSDAFAIEAEAC